MKVGDLVQVRLNSRSANKGDIGIFLAFDSPFGEWCYVQKCDGTKLRVPWAHLDELNDY